MCDIVIVALIREPAPQPPLTRRKCFKCGETRPIERFKKSPLPDRQNRGHTWQCDGPNCLSKTDIDYGGALVLK